MVNYQELGLSNTKKMLADAYEGRYAVPALNFISIEQFNAIIDACEETESPVIAMVATKHCRQFGYETLTRIAMSGVDRLRNHGLALPVALHLDHGMTFEDCKAAIDSGFSSVMIDGSGLPLEENISLTRRVADYAHRFGVSVEGELGALSGAEDPEETEGQGCFTDPPEAARFIRESGADSLAVSVGTVHGLYKLHLREDGEMEPLRYDILEQIEAVAPGFPLVLHGCSALDPYYAEMNNRYGGDLPPMQGIPDSYIRRAAGTAVCKINIASDGWLAALAITRKTLAESPKALDTRVFTQRVRPALKELYLHKIELMGSGKRTTGIAPAVL